MHSFIAKVSLPYPDCDFHTLSLVAEDRRRSFYQGLSDQGDSVKINLKRGTLLKDGDVLTTDANALGDRTYLLIRAKPEPVLTVSASEPVYLLQAAYHLGNRHVLLEIQETYLRLTPDPVIRAMLAKMPVTVTQETLPFHPEAGAYAHGHG